MLKDPTTILLKLSHSVSSFLCLDPVDLDSITHLQETDPELPPFRDRLTSFLLFCNLSVWCDVSTPHLSPFVPAHIKRQLFDDLHDMSFPGGKSFP